MEPTTTPELTEPTVAPDYPPSDAPKPSRAKRIPALVATALACAAALFGGGYLVGSNAADDAAQVADLEDQLASSESSAADLEEQVSDLRDDRTDLEDDVTDLQEQLDAERNLQPGSTKSQQAGASNAAVPTDVQIGQAADVGSMTLKLTSFTQMSPGQWRAAFTVKNNGSEPIGPYCGGGGAEMIDKLGRTFGGDSVLSDSTANCGDDVQPGLSGNFAMDFKASPDTKPAAVKLWDDWEYDSSGGKVWAVN